MGRILSPEMDLQRLSDNSSEKIVERVLDLFRAERSGSTEKRQRALSKFADVIRRSQALADILGRRRAFLELDAALAAQKKVVRMQARGIDIKQIPWTMYADVVPGSVNDPTPTIPNVPFEEALKDIVAREPRLAGTAQEVADVYSREHGFALARSAQQQVTEKVQDIISRVFGPDISIRQGIQQISEAALLQQAEPFSRAYAETVFRTNLNTAFTAGRFQQAADPDISQAMPAFEYSVISDSALRSGRPQDEYARGMAEDHESLSGLVASTGWQGWQIFAPPNGYNCRCNIRLVSIFELRQRGFISNFSDPVPEPTVPSPEVVHPRFRGGRPDQLIYFGVKR